MLYNVVQGNADEGGADGYGLITTFCADVVIEPQHICAVNSKC